jgi:hypothetical protein
VVAATAAVPAAPGIHPMVPATARLVAATMPPALFIAPPRAMAVAGAPCASAVPTSPPPVLAVVVSPTRRRTTAHVHRRGAGEWQGSGMAGKEGGARGARAGGRGMSES